MLRPRLFTLLPVALLLACSDAPTSSTAKTGPALPPVAPAVLSYTGIVENTLRDLDYQYLRVPGGERIRLVGPQTARLARVSGAEVSVRGTADAVDGLIVESFLVVSVGGVEAIDGVLMKVGEQYALRLILDGSMRMLTDLPDELKGHVGERVWITGPADGVAVAYGVIGGDS